MIEGNGTVQTDIVWTGTGPAPGANVTVNAGLKMNAFTRSDIRSRGEGSEEVSSRALGRGSVTLTRPGLSTVTKK